MVDLFEWRFNLENLRFYGVLSLGGVLERFACFVALWLCFVACALFVVKLGFRCGVNAGWNNFEEWKVYLINIKDVGEER